MKVFVAGKKQIELRREDFIAKGGEGQIFGKGDRIFKIYFRPEQMISRAKIDELNMLNRSNILTPKEIVFDANNTPIGFTMDWIKGTIPLCRLFASDFRTRFGLTQTLVLDLVEKMKETILFIHQQNCLIVDGNEFNYLIDGTLFKTPYFIDVDSYQTPSFKATAIMETIKDYQAQSFSSLTDWFAFAIIICQLFIGIHPFKGRHPNYRKTQLEARMRDHVSIFNPKVTLPPAARDFSHIPKAYFDWFLDLFEKGKRLPPPDPKGATGTIRPQFKLIHSSNQIQMTQIMAFEQNIIDHYTILGYQITRTENQIHIDQKKYANTKGGHLFLSPNHLHHIIAHIDNNRLVIKSMDKNVRLNDLNLQAESILNIENRLYLKYMENLIQIEFNDIQKQIIPSITNRWTILPHATQTFTGMLYQNILGKPYVIIPYPNSQKGNLCIIKQISELEPFRIVDAKHDSGICMFVVHDGKAFHRIILRFDDNYKNYDCRIAKNIDTYALNFVTLSTGVVVSANDDGLEIFHKNLKRQDVIQINDQNIDFSVQLCKHIDQARFFKANTLFRIRLQKN